MDWVRGGTWVLSDDPRLPDPDELAIGLRLLPDQHPRAERTVVAGDMAAVWWWAIGEPAGLTRYDIHDAIAREIIADYRDVVGAAPNPELVLSERLEPLCITLAR